MASLFVNVMIALCVSTVVGVYLTVKVTKPFAAMGVVGWVVMLNCAAFAPPKTAKGLPESVRFVTPRFLMVNVLLTGLAEHVTLPKSVLLPVLAAPPLLMALFEASVT